MELRKDPITRSWVAVGQPEEVPPAPEGCPLCPDHAEEPRPLLVLPPQGTWQVRVIPHLDPLYRIEGEPRRKADGIYDNMRPVGAHEIIIETPEHNRQLAEMSDDQIDCVLSAYMQRIQDLKRDMRFKYVTVFKNCGALAGEEWVHSHSQITATTFVPRRILYELRSSREWFLQKERCVFCDILRQEEKRGKRVVDSQGEYVALCPYASRVPYELWLLERKHNHVFEQPRPGSNRRNLAALLGRVLRRLAGVSQAYHLVVHTAPNPLHTKGELLDYWKTIADDYHWHIEILPIVQTRSKSYSIKEVYFNDLMPEQAAERLRQVDPSG
ncbi:MAG: galactose-1-phosphate uridylyltransferase [Acidobacteria bacterium]|nr:galactose-1-phosphate uridylyltransferase [Acidobacteriota bacterium]